MKRREREGALEQGQQLSRIAFGSNRYRAVEVGAVVVVAGAI